MKNEDDYIIFMFPKKEVHSINRTISYLCKHEMKDNLMFKSLAKEFTAQFVIDDERTYSLEEAALILGKSERMVRRYINSGKLYANKPHGYWRIPEKDLTEFAIKQRPNYYFPHCG
jgi:excisionase family DNA binding protein